MDSDIMSAKPTKVFCIGFMKTGTTTMNSALTILGYRVSHRSWRLLPAIMKGDWNSVANHAEAWDALEDNPIPLIYKELDQLFPNSKFILTKRDPEKWYQSVSYHIGRLRSPMHEWVFGKGKGLPIEDKGHTIEVFNQHTESVLTYFKERPQDLLILDVTTDSNWKTICDFLGVSTPSVPFPHSNRSKFEQSKISRPKQKFKFIKKQVFNPMKIGFYSLLGYLPTPETRIKS